MDCKSCQMFGLFFMYIPILGLHHDAVICMTISFQSLAKKDTVHIHIILFCSILSIYRARYYTQSRVVRHSVEWYKFCACDL